jgi:hypothetical protein
MCAGFKVIAAIRRNMDSANIISWTRFGVLFLALGLAAWMDHKDRRVPNSFWIVWAKPAIFLWVLDLMNQDAPWYTYATAAGVVAYASIAVIGRPSLNDILSGKKLDISVMIWYLVGIVGIAQGAALHAIEGPMPVLVGDADLQTTLWWSTVAVILPIFLVDLAWRLRLIHGGADCKGLMWISILVPTWSSIPVIYPDSMASSVIALPPAIAILVWSGLAFLLLPFLMATKNLLSGETSLRLIWHAEKMPIDMVKENHVWLLTTLADMPDGNTKVIHRTRAPSRTPSAKQLDDAILALKEHDVEMVWVTRKFPLLVFLWPAIIPVLLVGGPMAFVMPMIGL